MGNTSIRRWIGAGPQGARKRREVLPRARARVKALVVSGVLGGSAWIGAPALRQILGDAATTPVFRVLAPFGEWSQVFSLLGCQAKKVRFPTAPFDDGLLDFEKTCRRDFIGSYSFTHTNPYLFSWFRNRWLQAW